MLEPFEVCVRPAHAVSYTVHVVVIATTAVDESAVVLDRIMYGDDVTDGILKVCARPTLDQSKQRCFPQILRTKPRKIRS